ncbi:hypothetical protein BCR44DRAFT_1446926 [Catenaria anguillulae PL171]|uniref:Uncharacterized protein n=1 Tax=Catenaria anguillulae PL171 TaxID=765915 RepID=A0A1Y2H8D9_9FUNG|nr:hypothetical protein BCR44DRAFT_1446926 [Catenaria anguillulae PL171]
MNHRGDWDRGSNGGHQGGIVGGGGKCGRRLFSGHGTIGGGRVSLCGCLADLGGDRWIHRRDRGGRGRRRRGLRRRHGVVLAGLVGLVGVASRGTCGLSGMRDSLPEPVGNRLDDKAKIECIAFDCATGVDTVKLVRAREKPHIHEVKTIKKVTVLQPHMFSSLPASLKLSTHEWHTHRHIDFDANGPSSLPHGNIARPRHRQARPGLEILQGDRRLWFHKAEARQVDSFMKSPVQINLRTVNTDEIKEHLTIGHGANQVQDLVDRQSGRRTRVGFGNVEVRKLAVRLQSLVVMGADALPRLERLSNGENGSGEIEPQERETGGFQHEFRDDCAKSTTWWAKTWGRDGTLWVHDGRGRARATTSSTAMGRNHDCGYIVGCIIVIVQCCECGSEGFSSSSLHATTYTHDIWI